MKSFQERFYLYEPSVPKTLWRDLRMLVYVLKVACAWLFTGARVRRAYGRARCAGEIWWIDELDREDI